MKEEATEKKVKLGSRVKVRSLGQIQEEVKEFLIVDSSKVNPKLGKISTQSPVGRALLGRKKGDRVVININPELRIFYQIISVL